MARVEINQMSIEEAEQVSADFKASSRSERPGTGNMNDREHKALLVLMDAYCRERFGSDWDEVIARQDQG